MENFPRVPKHHSLLKTESQARAGAGCIDSVLKIHWISACARMTCPGLPPPVGVFQQGPEGCFHEATSFENHVHPMLPVAEQSQPAVFLWPSAAWIHTVRATRGRGAYRGRTTVHRTNIMIRRKQSDALLHCALKSLLNQLANHTDKLGM
jgi:hypothetical protein